MSQGRFAALGNRDFALLWCANVVSRVGTSMRDVALAWQIFMLTRSPVALGLLGAFRVIPVLLLALGGGVTADAFDRRRVLIATQSLLAITSVAMAILAWTDRATPGLLYALTALSAA